MGQILLREMNNEDEPSLIELLNQVTGIERSRDQWEWMYKKSPAGKSIIVLAFEGKVIGQCALIPIKLKIKNEICLGSWSPDSLVAPEFQRRGIFSGLVKKSYALGEQRNFQVVWGFPNANSHSLMLEKHSWVDMYDGLPLWVKPLNLENLLYRYIKHARLMAKIASWPFQMIMDLGNKHKEGKTLLEIRKVTNIDEQFNDLWTRASTSHENMVVRDKEYLTWRFIEKPGVNYDIFTIWNRNKLEGYIVLCCQERFDLKIGHIVDILVSVEHSYLSRQLIAMAVKYFYSKKADIISCLMLPNSYIVNSLKSEGFFISPKKLLPGQGYVGIRELSHKCEANDLINPANWYLTWGDCDII
jgi:hypothetical protein